MLTMQIVIGRGVGKCGSVVVVVFVAAATAVAVIVWCRVH